VTSQPKTHQLPSQVTLLTQPDCALCDRAKTILTTLADERLIVVTEVDLAGHEGRALALRHGVLFAPGVLVAGHPFSYGRLSEKKLRRHLSRRVGSEGRP
jgi:glutaredoxin